MKGKNVIYVYAIGNHVPFLIRLLQFANTNKRACEVFRTGKPTVNLLEYTKELNLS